jgi:type II secretory pathway pseudopilin PulG
MQSGFGQLVNPLRDSALRPIGRLPVHTAGYVLLMLLFLTVIIGLALVAVVQVYSTAAAREREQQLLFAGNQFRLAISSYYNSPAGAKHEYPETLEQLLLDPRDPGVRRYLRRVYVDPMTGKAEWGLIKAGGRIVGVYSLGTRAPLKTSGFPTEYAQFSEAKDYGDWKFQAAEGVGASAGTTAQPGPAVPAPPGNRDVAADRSETAPVQPPSPSPETGSQCEREYRSTVRGCRGLPQEAALQCMYAARASMWQCMATGQ